MNLDLTDKHAQSLGGIENTVVPIKFPVINILDAGVGHDLKAIPTRRGGDVDVGAVHPHAVLGGLDNGVGLRVNGRHAMVVFHHMARVVAMGKAPDAPVVTR